jgi:hypothetical protein
MFRIIITCSLVAAATAGCAQIPAPSAQVYHTTDSRLECPALEGSGDCQPDAGGERLSQSDGSASVVVEDAT